MLKANLLRQREYCNTIQIAHKSLLRLVCTSEEKNSNNYNHINLLIKKSKEVKCDINYIKYGGE